MTPIRLLMIALVGTLVACGGARQSRPGDAEPTTVAVDNRSFSDMTIYLVEAGSRRRLGTATGVSTTVLTIPASFVSLGRELQLLADPIGGRRAAVSNRIFIRPGEQVTLTIPP